MKNKRLVNGYIVPTKAKDIVGCNILRAEVGTNGYRGGASGHGSRTYIRLEDMGGTDITFKIKEDGKALEILIGGDSELTTITEALVFCAKRLVKASSESICLQ